MDYLNSLLRMAILTAWGQEGMLAKFKGLVVEQWLLELENTTLDEYAKAEWGCGDSSSRLCMLLVGDEMNADVRNGIDLADDAAVGAAYKAMLKTEGYLLARLNVYTLGVSHAFIWLSKDRQKATSPLDGYIYQTNIGIGRAHNFDLNNWVSDKKSSDLVYLPGYITELQAQFTGLRKAPGDAPKAPLQASRVYEQDFSLSDKSVSPTQAIEIDRLAVREVIKSYMSWKPVDRNTATLNLSAFAKLK